MTDTDAAADARALLGRAREALMEVRRRGPRLASAMAWRSPSAREFGVALADWLGLLDRIEARLSRWDDDLRRAALARAAREAGNL